MLGRALIRATRGNSRKEKQTGAKIFHSYAQILNFYNAAGIYPIRWNFRTHEIVVMKMNPTSSAIHVLLVITHLAFLNYQSVRTWFTSTPVLDKVFLSLQVGVYTTGAANFSLMFSKPSMIAALINNVAKMQWKYDSKSNILHKHLTLKSLRMDLKNL